MRIPPPYFFPLQRGYRLRGLSLIETIEKQKKYYMDLLNQSYFEKHATYQKLLEWNRGGLK